MIVLVFGRESREIEGLKMSFGTILTMAGGLGLFLFGMELMSDSIEKVAGARLRRILEIFTTNRFMGMIVGIIFTGIIRLPRPVRSWSSASLTPA